MSSSLLRILPATRWEYPFWIAFFYWSLFPSRTAVRVDVLDIPVDSRDICLLVLAVIYSVPLLQRFLYGVRALRPAGFRLLCASFALIAYSALSLTWSAIEDLDSRAMLFTLILLTASVFVGYGLARLLPTDALPDFLRRTGVALAVVCAAYSSDSFFELGFRSADFMRQELDFGIARVGGPLFGSSTGYFLIVPALAGLLQDLASKRGTRWASVSCITLLGITLFALGSRGGILIIGCFVLLCLFFVRDTGGKLLTVTGTVIVLALAASLVLQRGEIARVQSFEDRVRLTFHENAYEIVANRDILDNLVGSGYGSVWPWYRLDDFVTDKKFSLSVQTSEGSLTAGRFLYHPHSVLLLLGVEVGIVGVAYLVYMWVLLWRMLRAHSRSGSAPIWVCGIVASAASLLLDLFLFYRPRMAVVWWVWIFIAFRSVRAVRTHRLEASILHA